MTPGGHPQPIRSDRSLVLDSYLECRFLPSRKSIWAKRTMKATFGVAGALSGLDVETTATAAGMAQTLATLPSTASTALTQSASVADQAHALRSKQLDQDVDRATKLLVLKQSELAGAGLEATERDYAQLERLKQRVEIAVNSAKLAPWGL